jgi:hypothetical protein
MIGEVYVDVLSGEEVEKRDSDVVLPENEQPSQILACDYIEVLGEMVLEAFGEHDVNVMKRGSGP